MAEVAALTVKSYCYILALLLVLPARGILSNLSGLIGCRGDNIGLCVVDSLGLGITCHITVYVLCVRGIPDLVSLDFYAIPIFHILISHLL